MEKGKIYEDAKYIVSMTQTITFESNEDYIDALNGDIRFLLSVLKQTEDALNNIETKIRELA